MQSNDQEVPSVATPPETQVKKETEEKVYVKIKPNDNDDARLLNYATCHYCYGVIQKKTLSNRFCSKSCSETYKMFPLEAVDGKTQLKVSFARRETTKDWGYYKEMLRERGALPTAFNEITEHVAGLEPGMKLEALDMMNPVNYCVATVIRVLGHRLCIRYDGFGDDVTQDYWFNFQSDELYPIGWCSQNGFSLQPPTGIATSSNEWKSFLSSTLTGALAAPANLFRKPDKRRQMRCYSYLTGGKVEVIHPKRPDLICPATVTKSLGPYYFLVTTDLLPGVPPYTFYSYADAAGVYPFGWCEAKGLMLDLSNPASLKMVRRSIAVDQACKKTKINPFRIGQKLEALDNSQICVGTIAEIFGRVALLVFDNKSNRRRFVDKNASDIYPLGWCEKTDGLLVTPYGVVNFQPPNPIKSKSGQLVVHSASFKQFKLPIAQKDLESVNMSLSISVSSPSTSAAGHSNDVNTTMKMEENLDDDVDIDMPLSPKSPSSGEKHINEMECFVVWLLNHYEYDYNEMSFAVKQELVDDFVNFNHVKLSPRWFALIYKLFPGVSTVRRSVDGKFINCIRYMKDHTYQNNNSPIFIKDVAEFLKGQKIQFLMDSVKLVILIGIGDQVIIPPDTNEIFIQSKAKKNSSILTISADINPGDFTLYNYMFYFEENPCMPPLDKIFTIAEFRASVKICKIAQICKGVEVIPRGDNTIPNFRHGKVVRNGRLFSSNCNTLAFVHKGNICVCCKSVRYHQRNPTTNSTIANSGLSSPIDSIDSPLQDGNEDLKDENIAISLQFYFNTSCYIGHLLDAVKVAKMWNTTPKDRPAQALKYLVERLIEVSNSKEKFLEMIEDCFGARLYNKEKDKVMKKGLFRFNTRRKVLKFLTRLNKRLQCCDYFINIDRKNCAHNCANKSKQIVASRITNSMAVRPPAMSNQMQYSPSIQHQQPLNNTPQQNSIVRQPFPTNNMQLVYQLPPSTPNTPTGPPQILVQTPTGQNINLQNSFTQGGQYIVPQNASNLTYMVVSKDNLSNVHVPASVASHLHQPQLNVSSPTSGVTQMIANVSKSSLLTDIDDPLRHSKKAASSITVVKGGIGPSTQQLVIKKHDPNLQHLVSTSHHNVSISPMNKSPIYREHNQQIHFPRLQNSYNEPQPLSPQEHGTRPVVQTADKNQQKHVHKIHHGNARVKYVEYKPMQDGNQMEGMYQPNIYHPARLPMMQQNSNPHLTIHTPGSNQGLMQQSPPALRPPPQMPSRSIGLSSPPSLVASPELRPRFNFSQNPNNSTPIRFKHNNYPQQNKNFDKNRQVTFAYGVHPQNIMNKTMEHHQQIQHQQGNIMGRETGQASATGQNGQPILFYPQNQQLKDSNGKPIILSPQIMQTANRMVTTPRMEGESPYTTVRIQGGRQNLPPQTRIVHSPHTPLSMQQKSFKYQFGGNVNGLVERNPASPRMESPKYHNAASNFENEKMNIKMEDQSTASQINMLPPSSHPAEKEIGEEIIGMKRKHTDSSSTVDEASPTKKDENSENKTPPHKIKKRRGRPPSASKLPIRNDGVRSKLSMINNNPLPASMNGNPITLANRVLTETFYKKQRDCENRANFLHDPLLKCTDLPSNPEDWNPLHVYTFMMNTDCSQYAEILKEEEVDGKSFLLLTREALMEFVGMRLGPALKIAGHAAYLRARHRMHALNLNQPPVNKKDPTTKQHRIRKPKEIRKSIKSENKSPSKIKKENEIQKALVNGDCTELVKINLNNDIEMTNDSSLIHTDLSLNLSKEEPLSTDRQSMNDMKNNGNGLSLNLSKDELPNTDNQSKNNMKNNENDLSNENIIKEDTDNNKNCSLNKDQVLTENNLENKETEMEGNNSVTKNVIKEELDSVVIDSAQNQDNLFKKDIIINEIEVTKLEPVHKDIKSTHYKVEENSNFETNKIKDSVVTNTGSSSISQEPSKSEAT